MTSVSCCMMDENGRVFRFKSKPTNIVKLFQHPSENEVFPGDILIAASNAYDL